ncbi:MAG: hypothetical protein KDB27_33115 [Planctomycetales bacterium]|nr:hypothetical protein [Planctomycetales bacterium]
MPPDDQNKISIADGITLALMIVFSLTRTVQLFSRLPGTVGPWFLSVFYIVGLSIQLYYCEMKAATTGVLDLVPTTLFLSVCILWHFVHGVFRRLAVAKGAVFHSYEPGLGVLCYLYHGWKLWQIGLISDLAVASTLSFVFYVLRCPHLSSWYLSMIPWLLVGQAYLFVRERFERQTVNDAQIESQIQSQKLWRR